METEIETVTEVVVDVAETVVDAVPEKIIHRIGLRMGAIWAKPWVPATVLGVGGIGVGLGIGWVVTKRIEKKRMQQQIDDVQLFVDTQMSLFGEDPIEELGQPDPKAEEVISDYYVEVVEEYTDNLQDITSRRIYTTQELDDDAEIAIEEEEEEDGEPVQNVFAKTGADWDYEIELNTRNGKDPYVIHVDEFVADEMEYSQSTVTYYAGDDVLADENDAPIYGYEAMFGELKFGHGSGDKSVVYIRNEPFAQEWEVLLHTGRYAVEVEGQSIEAIYEGRELKHSNPQRFRDE